MIQFACRCRQIITVEDDQAGADTQCPNCGLLVTVPSLSEMEAIARDGTYTIEDHAVLTEQDRLNTLHRAFTRQTTTEDGEQIDNRITPEELALAGDIPLADDSFNEKPKYDPVTGELVRPLELVRPDVPSADEIPMAKAAITYAAAAPRPTNLASVAALLTHPGNIAVIGVMYMLFLLNIGVLIVANIFPFVGVFALIIVFGAIGHMANIIDEIGPRDMDDLPRPFRDLQLGEDIWMPFVHVMGSIMLSFGPTAIAFAYSQHLSRPLQLGVLVTALAWAGITFPALLITTSTSGTVLNLRPDRIWSVMTASFGAYIGLAILGIVSLALLVFSSDGVLINMAFSQSARPAYAHPTIVFPVSFLAIFMIHLFAWQCGLYYRGNHADFKWLYQRHVPKNKMEAAALNEARRAVRKHVREIQKIEQDQVRKHRRW